MDVEVSVNGSGIVSELYRFYVTYIDFIGGILLGVVIVVIYNRFVGQRSLRKSYERTITALEDQIKTLKGIVSERLESIDVEEISDKRLIKNLKKYFKSNSSK
ncbi:hypothetical protein [uncultured Sunxiuqinia sp.]|uniref:hypothetical protein n=1 Tax=uncultured Sunxiuqinia sp. TaxID=1573825 RepID=UPI002AA84347|nr:hypothetical protein [uncultured Sunxiuqinia sp.]